MCAVAAVTAVYVPGPSSATPTAPATTTRVQLRERSGQASMAPPIPKPEISSTVRNHGYHVGVRSSSTYDHATVAAKAAVSV